MNTKSLQKTLEQHRAQRAWDCVNSCLQDAIQGLNKAVAEISEKIDHVKDEEQKKQLQTQRQELEKRLEKLKTPQGEAGWKKGYSSLARKVPMLVLTNGLGQTLAFLKAEGKNDPADEHTVLFRHLSDWVLSQVAPSATASNGDLLQWVLENDSVAYRRATTEALAFLTWLKRFAEAELPTEEGDNMPGPRHPRRGPRSPENLGSSEEMAWRFPLPPEVRDQATGLQTCLNPGLWLDHFTEWEERRGELKRAEASDKRRRIPKSFTHPEVGPLLLAYRNRWDRMIDALRAQNYIVQKFTLRAASRVIVGLGAESVLETSIRLHRIYGFPIIPGSALKGLARAYAFWNVAKELGIPAISQRELFEREQRRERTPLQKFEKCVEEPEAKNRAHLLDELKRDKAVPQEALICRLDIDGFEQKTGYLRAVFGTIRYAGQVLFLDAIPANPANLTLELDVMNPHYGPYYQRSEPPADYHNPGPVFFLTIGPGSEFLFAVASRERGLAQKAQQWLTCALTEMGIGAKTVAGYGLWTNVQENSAASSDPGRSTAATSPQPEPQPPAGRPDRPEVLKELPRKADAWIPAEVVDNTTRPMKVRLFVEGYLDRPVDCSGVGNPNSFPRGTFVRVAIVQRQKDGTVTMVRLVGLWRAS